MEYTLLNYSIRSKIAYLSPPSRVIITVYKVQTHVNYNNLLNMFLDEILQVCFICSRHSFNLQTVPEANECRQTLYVVLVCYLIIYVNVNL